MQLKNVLSIKLNRSKKQVKKYCNIHLMENLLKNTPLTVFKKEVSALTRVQVDSLISYAINKKIIDPDKCSWLKDLTGKDILKSIS